MCALVNEGASCSRQLVPLSSNKYKYILVCTDVYMYKCSKVRIFDCVVEVEVGWLAGWLTGVLLVLHVDVAIVYDDGIGMIVFAAAAAVAAVTILTAGWLPLLMLLLLLLMAMMMVQITFVSAFKFSRILMPQKRRLIH